MSPDGNFIAVGGPGDNRGVGATWVFKWNGSYFAEFDKIVGITSEDMPPSLGTTLIQEIES